MSNSMEYLDEYAAAGWEHAQELGVQLREQADAAALAWRRAEELAEHARNLDEALQQQGRFLAETTYRHDGLATWNKVTPFLDDERFLSAYQEGMNSGHHIARPKGSDADIHIEWRVHTICWAAAHAARLDGDFVECGVNTGIYALAVCRYMDFNALDRDFWLFDTYRGIPVELASDAERERVIKQNSMMYEECYELARANFAPYPRAQLVRGVVPETLATVKIDRVAFLSLDLDLAAAEVAALEHFWPKLVTGAVVLLDDFGWMTRATQREAMQALARRLGVEILSLPTGQGMLLKP